MGPAATALIAISIVAVSIVAGLAQALMVRELRASFARMEGENVRAHVAIEHRIDAIAEAVGRQGREIASMAPSQGMQEIERLASVTLAPTGAD